ADAGLTRSHYRHLRREWRANEFFFWRNAFCLKTRNEPPSTPFVFPGRASIDGVKPIVNGLSARAVCHCPLLTMKNLMPECLHSRATDVLRCGPVPATST